MASTYTLNFSDLTKTATITITGPIKNNYDTSLDLVGPGYVNYGQTIAQDFLKLLENFASPNAPINPIEGQLWYDTSNPNRKVLRVNNGEATSARWPSANGIYQQANDPSIQYSQNLVEGDIWVDTGNTQVKIRYGNSWTLVGPSVSTGNSKTGSESVELVSNTGDTYPVILNWANGKVVEIISYNSFTPRTVIDGFTTLGIGLNLNSRVAAKYNGLADRAKSLEISNGVYVQASEVLKNIWPTSQRQVHAGALVVESPVGLSVRRQSGSELQIYTTSSGGVINYGNAASALKVGIYNNSYIKFNASNGNVGINTSTVESVALSVNGAATFKDTITVTSANSSTVGLTLTGKATIAGSLTVGGSLRVTGLTTISNAMTVGDIIPATLTASLGSPTKPFENIYVANLGSSSTYVKIYGSVTTATQLESTKLFQIVGHTTSTAVGFNGSSNVTFVTTATRELINSPTGGSTSTTTATQTLLILNTATTDSSLQRISKSDFLADIYPVLFTTGMIIPSGTSTVYNVNGTISASYLLCDGHSQLQGGTYTNLFSVIGTRYGTQGAGTFRVPNLLDVTTSTTATFVASIFYHIKT